MPRSRPPAPAPSEPPPAGRYVTAARFIRACRSFAADERVELRFPITLLVGEQGAGKSTVLAAIRQAGVSGPLLAADLQGAVALEGPLGCPVQLVDLERANPRMRPLEDPFAVEEMPRLLHALRARRQSHGEALLPLLAQLDGRTGSLILLDTPETALSIGNQYRLAATLARAPARGCPVVAATHSAILIASQPQVLDLTRRQWVAGSAYLAAAADGSLDS